MIHLATIEPTAILSGKPSTPSAYFRSSAANRSIETSSPVLFDCAFALAIWPLPQLLGHGINDSSPHVPVDRVDSVRNGVMPIGKPIWRRRRWGTPTHRISVVQHRMDTAHGDGNHLAGMTRTMPTQSRFPVPFTTHETVGAIAGVRALALVQRHAAGRQERGGNAECDQGEADRGENAFGAHRCYFPPSELHSPFPGDIYISIQSPPFNQSGIRGILVICPGAPRSPTTTRMLGDPIFILGWGGEVAPISDGRGPGLPGAWRKTRRRAELSAFITCVNVRRFI
jgi:hypothetical protein